MAALFRFLLSVPSFHQLVDSGTQVSFRGVSSGTLNVTEMDCPGVGDAVKDISSGPRDKLQLEKIFEACGDDEDRFHRSSDQSMLLLENLGPLTP